MSEYDKELESDSNEVDEAESKLGRGEKREHEPLKDSGEVQSSDPHKAEHLAAPADVRVLTTAWARDHSNLGRSSV
jgi:hypothetical protein